MTESHHDSYRQLLFQQPARPDQVRGLQSAVFGFPTASYGKRDSNGWRGLPGAMAAPKLANYAPTGATKKKRSTPMTANSTSGAATAV